ncbi:hypothetical protein K0U00_26670, partial [Paenibacillus sepulcri]|nr:hypothetical protein [Paenibacillus sepulcri]
MDAIISIMLLLFHVLSGGTAQSGQESASTSQLLSTLFAGHGPAQTGQGVQTGTGASSGAGTSDS